MKEKKYYSLYKKIKEAILQGEYRFGSKLPSKRVMADRTGCSVITVENAYGLLYDEGYLETRERSGYYVKKIDGVTLPVDKERIKLKFLQEEKRLPQEDFEYSSWVKTVRKVVSEKGKELFVKSPVFGIPALRNAISEYLLRYRGMLAQPEQIIIGSGAEQLYENALKILGRDKIYGIEQPCYQGIKSVYLAEGVKTIGLKMGAQGIESQELEKKLDVLHVTPFNSYPSGITATIGKRYEYLSWAKKGPRYIIEDDFASEFFIPGHPIDSLYAMDDSEKVIYINTFSKSLSPSMRVGYMILPQHLLWLYKEKFGCFSCSVPVLDQYVLAEFINSGSFERHLNKVRRKMKNQK